MALVVLAAGTAALTAVVGHRPDDAVPAAAVTSPTQTPTPSFTVPVPVPAARVAPPSRSRPRIAMPVAGKVLFNARFGQRGEHWRYRHTGLDFAAWWGTPIHSVADGKIVKAAYHPAYGNVLVVKVGDHTNVWYCHLSSYVRKSGHVKAGEVIAKAGATGNVTGAHLHLEVRVRDHPTNPMRYLFGKPGSPGKPAPWIPDGFVALDSF